ncbi:DUF4446 family protein [Conexibacter sp. DBS9H8]|uniref:DUF4446 family protein n=1 Tax=Conexibacter sp. DBS9H8 TaxID=2937801 RepID=UPI00200FDAD0|nr:DUF4446 family protein [Conexibacter sp. DBS9H8]
MSGSANTTQIVAIAAGAVAVIALLWALSLTVALRRLRAAQRMVLGDRSTDLVSHAAALAREFHDLDAAVRDGLTRFESRILATEARLDGAIAYRSLVRYDAYGEMSGHQSTSIALLDATRSGIVLSSIHHRDQARLYVKQIHAGRPDLELSPEEADAVRLALSGERQSSAEEPGDDGARVRVRRPRG